MLYNRARAVLNKDKKVPATKPSSGQKPPLQKRRSEAVLEVLRKQERIRRDLSNRNSFHQPSVKNPKTNTQNKDRRSFRASQEKLIAHKSITKKSMASLNSHEQQEEKKPKPSKITRKEARARIGLADIPDDRIEELVKNKKSKLQSTSPKNSEVVGDQIYSIPSYSKPRSRMGNEFTLENSKSNPKATRSTMAVKEVIKIKQSDSKNQRPNVVQAKIPDVHYDHDLNSSINDFDEFTPVYHEPPKSKSTKLKIKSKPSKGKEDSEAQPSKTQEDTQAEIHQKKELVKLQRKAKLKKIKEQKELEKQAELKKKENLESLNNMFKKRTESFKKKKVVESKEDVNSSLIRDDDTKNEVINRLTAKTTNTSHESFKVQHFAGHRLSMKHDNKPAMTSATHSIQSPASRQVYPANINKRQKGSISDQSTNVSHAHNFNGRKTFNHKSTKKCIRKVITLPTVKMSKNSGKSKKYDFADTIPENIDMSEVDSVAVAPKPVKAPKKTKQAEHNGRKVVISKYAKHTKDSGKKSLKCKSEK